MASVCKACDGRVVRGVDRASLLKHNMGCLHTWKPEEENKMEKSQSKSSSCMESQLYVDISICSRTLKKQSTCHVGQHKARNPYLSSHPH